jgi:hypothetical protein
MSSNIKIQSTYYPDHKPTFNEWSKGIAAKVDELFRVRYCEHDLQVRAERLARSMRAIGVEDSSN